MTALADHVLHYLLIAPGGTVPTIAGDLRAMGNAGATEATVAAARHALQDRDLIIERNGWFRASHSAKSPTLFMGGTGGSRRPWEDNGRQGVGGSD